MNDATWEHMRYAGEVSDAECAVRAVTKLPSWPRIHGCTMAYMVQTTGRPRHGTPSRAQHSESDRWKTQRRPTACLKHILPRARQHSQHSTVSGACLAVSQHHFNWQYKWQPNTDDSCTLVVNEKSLSLTSVTAGTLALSATVTRCLWHAFKPTTNSNDWHTQMNFAELNGYQFIVSMWTPIQSYILGSAVCHLSHRLLREKWKMEEFETKR